jgi:hypothetical protein
MLKCDKTRHCLCGDCLWKKYGAVGVRFRFDDWGNMREELIFPSLPEPWIAGLDGTIGS